MSTSEGSTVESCLALLSDGGGRVVVKYVDDFASLQAVLHESWIVEHHQSLSMITLELPAHGCLSLMHPAIEYWERERHDIRPLEDVE